MTDELDIAKTLSDKEIKGRDWDLKARELGLKPGQLIPGTQSWVPWIYEDLNQEDRVTFVPQMVASIYAPGRTGPNGNPVLAVDVNNLKCLMEVGVPNTINRFFYNVYENALDNAIALEALKRGGRENAPWDFDHWVYIPQALTFGVDLDGRYLKSSGYYELDQDGIPVVFKNTKLLAALYFDGALDINITRAELLGLIWMVYKARVKGKFVRFTSKFKRGKK
jgi:hypothetical protein